MILHRYLVLKVLSPGISIQDPSLTFTGEDMWHLDLNLSLDTLSFIHILVELILP